MNLAVGLDLANDPLTDKPFIFFLPSIFQHSLCAIDIGMLGPMELFLFEDGILQLSALRTSLALGNRQAFSCAKDCTICFKTRLRSIDHVQQRQNYWLRVALWVRWAVYKLEKSINKFILLTFNCLLYHLHDQVSSMILSVVNLPTWMPSISNLPSFANSLYSHSYSYSLLLWGLSLMIAWSYIPRSISTQPELFRSLQRWMDT